ncbi:MAG: glycosyltransferase [Candidatus Avoscillospira sp.]
MDALIFTCGTGGGHNAAAYAAAEALECRGHHVTVLDPYAIRGEGLDHRVGNFYIRLVQRCPGAFGIVYGLGSAYRRLPFRSPVYWINGRMAKEMDQYLKAHPVDVILMSHLFPGEILTYMKDHGMQVQKMIFLATDYTCIPFTEELDCDAYVLPSAAQAAEFRKRGVPAARSHPLGIPVRRAFGQPADKAAAREKLGLPVDKPCWLLAGGSMGAGQVKRAVEVLFQQLGRDTDVVLTVVCGSNEKLRRALTKRFGQWPALRCIGVTDRMADYLHACDVYMSKPGGLSSTEAAVAGIPLIHLPPIPGCETRNATYFSSTGMSLVVKNLKRDLPKALETLSNPKNAQKMQASQQKGVPQHAAEDICQLAEQLVGENAEIL